MKTAHYVVMFLVLVAAHFPNKADAATLTFTPTVTFTVTPFGTTPTATFSTTVTFTVTPTATTATATATPWTNTITATATPSATPTWPATRTRTPTMTTTFTATPWSTTPTATATRTATPTWPLTQTQTPSPTHSMNATATPTPTQTHDVTATPSPSISPTTTRTPLATTARPQTLVVLNNRIQPSRNALPLQIMLRKDAPGLVQMEIFSLRRQKVASPTHSHYAQGEHLLEWDGKTDTGADVPSGIYFAHILADSLDEFIKLVVIK